MTGRMIGVGVGPGDPELLTLKAARLIGSVPVVAYPMPDDGPSFARSIVADLLGKQVEEPIVVPMRRERFPAASVYDEAAERLGAHMDAGRDVVVLCEGDPFFYGSFMYLFARIAGRYAVEVVPGVSSIMAAAAASGVPLAARNDVLTVVPATLPDAEIETRIQAADAVAIIKLGRNFPRVRALLDRMGLTGSTRYCERVGGPEETLCGLSSLDDDVAPYFSLLLVYRGSEEWIVDLPERREGTRP